MTLASSLSKSLINLSLRYTCDQIDQSPVRSVEIRVSMEGYKNVAEIPIMALIPLPIPIIYTGIPSHSNVAVIKVPKLSKRSH